MSQVVIEVNNLGKQYRLGQVGTTTIVDDFKRWTHKIQGKEDPFLRIGEENDRSKKGNSDYVWALKDINFSIQQGEVLGIIGKNGAGKSTLLKILSRTTSPTVGEYKIKGRVASLLEVGTGFHPDLTGRENVFLNGAILGMTKTEIKKNFDAIIDFSGVERYIDTPVKRYSSGMYVRLAFAVAAYLESEILIVDEVLAVGDAEFKKKCLGKMSEVSKVGKTVLFVSHEINAIKELCNKGILLENGKLAVAGNIKHVIDRYVETAKQKLAKREWMAQERPGNDFAKIDFVKIVNIQRQENCVFTFEETVGIEVGYEILQNNLRVNICVAVYSNTGQLIFMSFPEKELVKTTAGSHSIICWFPKELLNIDWYTIRVNAHTFYPTNLIFDLIDVLQFEIISNENKIILTDYEDKISGVLKIDCKWELTSN